MSIKAIKPSGFKIPDRAFVKAELDRLGRQVTAQTKAYPAARPWKNPPPKTGPRAGGRRTGALGKSWDYRVTGDSTIVLRVNSTGVRYARYVQGRDQTRVMRDRSWLTVQENFAKYYVEAEKRLKAWAKVRVA